MSAIKFLRAFAGAFAADSAALAPHWHRRSREFAVLDILGARFPLAVWRREFVHVVKNLDDHAGAIQDFDSES